LLTSNEELNATNESLIAKTRELEDALKIINETKFQLIQSEKMASLGFLTAGIAHEINNPVNFISAGVQALQQIEKQVYAIIKNYQTITSQSNSGVSEELKTNIDNLSVKMQKILLNVLDGVNRISEIVNSLSLYSRNDGDSFSKQNIIEVIKSTLVILHNKFKGRITILQEYSDIPEIYCIHSRIGQLFMNILSNAVDAIEGKGEIIIRGSNNLNEKQVVFSIKDSGVGIPQANHKRIFDPFFTTKEVGKGTGLGLYIAYGVVEQHRGTIELISEPGNGTEFIIRLPYHPAKV
jgi:signal transduction histidine kinase